MVVTGYDFYLIGIILCIDANYTKICLSGMVFASNSVTCKIYHGLLRRKNKFGTVGLPFTEIMLISTS